MQSNHHERNGQHEDIDAIPLPPAERWPTLDQDAYHGIAGEVVNAILPETEADPVAILLQFLAAFGSVVGRKPYFPVEGDRHYTNLFAVVVGESSRGRKGTSKGRVMQVVGPVDDKWTLLCQASGLSTGEGLIWSVRDPTDNDFGIEDKRQMVWESEYGSVLRVMQRDGNTLSPIVRSAWDTGHLRSMSKTFPGRATGAHVSIVGHITRLELSKLLGDADKFNGFANRFLWCLSRRSKLLPDGGQRLDLERQTHAIATAVTAASSIGRMTRSQDAAELWREMYAELTADRPGIWGAVTGRAEAHVLRLSIIYALLDSSAVIDVENLKAAMAVWEYCLASARLIFGGVPDDPLAERVMTAIRAQPGLMRSEIHKRLGGHRKAAELVRALAKLRDQGRARAERMPMTRAGGHPGERWFPVDDAADGAGNVAS